MITRALLRSLRNDLPMHFTIEQLGNKGPYAKTVEGRCRFQCPHCSETLAVVNPRNNLAHCFHCAKNINNIDLLLAHGYEFRDAVGLLQRWLLLYNAQRDGPKLFARQTETIANREKEPLPLSAILRQELGNRSASAG
ncbi:MAG TPA: hypothetical protein VGP72_31215 [Planctomycetota bacterium]|jgi:hypothetical protein